MSTEKEGVTVQIKYKSVEKTFCGAPEEVWLLTNKFFSQFMPSFEIAHRLTLKVDLQRLVNECQDIIGLAPEGSYLLVPRSRLTDNETLCLLLLTGYIAYQLGKAETDGVTKEELQAKLGKDAKILSTRLSELVKSEVATRSADEKYRITTFGLMQMQKDVLPRIKAKIDS